MASSKPFTLGGDYFQTEVGEEVSTVKRLSVTPAPQSVVDAATSSGNLNGDGSINYVNVFGKGNYEQLAAPDSWMGSLANDSTYWGAIDQSIGTENPNVAGGDENLPFSGGVLATNTTTNNQPNTPTSVTLRYPANNTGGYDFLQITTYKRKPTENLFGGTGFDLGDVDDVAVEPVNAPVIALPMHPGISDSNSVDWGADQLNPLQLAGARVAEGLMSGLSNLDPAAAGTAALNVLKGAVGGALNEISENDIKAYFAGQAVGANIFTRATGKVINPNLELLFRGPQLRTFNYNYTFTPRDDAEAKVIRTIIRHFKKNMAVQRSSSGLFLETPNIFELKYIYSGGGQHPFLNKIKKCALTNFNVEYTPDGSYMTYRDGSMTSYGVTMQFSELTPIYSSNYDNSDDMGY
jgi:hypothetical protein